MAKFFKERLILLIALMIITPIGFYTKFYGGFHAKWVNNKLCDVFYVTFWILFFKLIFKKVNNIKISLIVFSITSLIDISQLWHPRFLEYIRTFFLGRTLLGSQFAHSDFLNYAIGAIIAYLILIWQD